MSRLTGRRGRPSPHWAHKIPGYAWVVVLLCAYATMTMGAFLILIAGGACLAVPIWITRREWAKKDAREASRIVEAGRRMRASRAKRIRRIQRNGEAGHDATDLMDRDTDSDIRSGDPSPATPMRRPFTTATLIHILKMVSIAVVWAVALIALAYLAGLYHQRPFEWSILP